MPSPLPRTLARFVLPPAAADASICEAADPESSVIYDRSSEEGLMLIAMDSRSCALPITCSFEPHDPPSLTRPLSDDAAEVFTNHQRFGAALDGDLIGRLSKLHGKIASTVAIHHFVLRGPIAERLNASLVAMAMHLEERALAREGDDGDAASLGAAAAGVSKSNRGGYQSEPTLFGGDAEAVGAPPQLSGCCQELRCVAGAALQELTGGGSDAAVEPSFLGALHEGVGWLNVNRSADANATHIHKPGCWSAVYFVSRGDAAGAEVPAPTAAAGTTAGGAPHAGHLVFRGGGRSARATHTYFAVPPTPGSLWLFPGSVPHCVFPRGEHERGARISVAMNFETRVA